jgi:hypothetical protein
MTKPHWLLALTVACVLAAVLWPAMPQPLNYHNFADRRELLTIPNLFDVVSNIGFLVAGIAGLVTAFRRETVFASNAERWPYAICFLGMLLTAFGSGFYHLAPDNERLFWDRMPMTIAFMSLVAAQVIDRISIRAGLWLLGPMLAVGAISVLYWRITERSGAGNVIPYGILQGYAVIALLLIALTYRSRYSHGNAVYSVFGCYVAAKVLEYFDPQIFSFGHVVSGHTLKHLFAGAAGLLLCRMLRQRRLVV